MIFTVFLKKVILITTHYITFFVICNNPHYFIKHKIATKLRLHSKN